MTSSHRLHARTAALAVVIAIVGVLLAAPAAHASFALTAPANNSFVALGKDITVRFDARCPADKKCGTWQTYNVFDVVEVKLRHATLDPDTKGLYGDSWAQAYYSAGNATLRTKDYMTAGKWLVETQWAECPITDKPYPGPGEAACTHQSLSRTLQVRAQLGHDTYPASLQMIRNSKNRNRIDTSMWAGCNAPTAKYRVDFLVQKRVRIKKRWRWVPMTRKVNNLRVAIDPSANIPRCVFKRSFMLPKTMKANDTLRVQLRTRTVGFSPAAKPRFVYSKAYTPSTLPGGNGGGITIGN